MKDLQLRYGISCCAEAVCVCIIVFVCTGCLQLEGAEAVNLLLTTTRLDDDCLL